MLVPLRWLKDYVEIDVSSEELEKRLFSSGFEVEEVKDVFKNVNKIVVAKLLSVEKHPDADKLNVWRIDAGKYGKLQIVTNAKNIRAGDLVPVALDGATLYSGDRIFNGKIRGVESFGMFCSGEELGITDDYYPGASVDGILRFNEEYPLGEEVKVALGMDDLVFDVAVTSNRPDCQSVLGIAREVAAILGKPLKEPNYTYHTVPEKTADALSVRVEAPDLCPRYIAAAVKNVKVEPSPLWMRKRLFLSGIRGIYNLVDVTNFVLNEMGQPMHAFDLDRLSGRELVVRRAKAGETIETLDKKSFTLSEENLVIADDGKPVCLAGVMGGLNSGITEETHNLAFEAAKFKRDNIRRTSRSLGQRSDSSARFEKGVDAYTTELAMNRALSLVDELKIGEICTGTIDCNAEKEETRVIKTEVKKIDDLLGVTVGEERIKDILTRLHFGVREEKGGLTVEVPPYREDVENYADLAEEVIRMYGYDNITGTMLKKVSVTNGGKNAAQKAHDKAKALLAGFGYSEIVTYSFISEKEYDKLDLSKTSEKYRYIRLMNPLGEDYAVMRTTLVPSMVNTLLFNQNRRNASAYLFECARTYHEKKDGPDGLPEEKQRIMLGAYGDDMDFFKMKGAVEELCKAFGVTLTFAPGGEGYYHPTRKAEFFANGNKVGEMGEFGPVYHDRYGLDKKIYLAEIDYDALFKEFDEKIVFRAISRYPESAVDVAVTVDKDVPCADLIATIRDAAGEHLKEVALFDVYEGEQVTRGKKSMAFTLKFGTLTRTLEQSEVENAKAAVLSALEEKFGAKLR